MKKTHRRTPESPSTETSERRQGGANEVRALFNRMLGEATRRSEADSKSARSRGPFERVLLALAIAACLIAAATGVYGVYNFPDAPIRQTESGYVGKGGNVRSQDDFEKFILWKRVMFVAFPSAFALGFAFAIADGKRRKRQSKEQ